MGNIRRRPSCERPLRTEPVANEAEVQAMLAKLKGRVKVNGGSGEPIASVRLPDGAGGHTVSKPSPTPSANSNAGLILPPAGQTDSAAEITPTPSADGGSLGSVSTCAHPFQPTRSATLNGGSPEQSGELNVVTEGGVNRLPTAATALIWKRGEDKWTRVTECGRYRINISVTSPSGALADAIYGYAAWKVCPDWDFALGSFLSGSEARETCQRFEDSNRDPD